MPATQSHHTIARCYRNRLFRITLSKHLWDLKIIATLAVVISVPIICIWIYIWLNSAANTNELDETTDMLYAATACLELHSEQIDAASVRLLGKARDDVATARGKVQNVNSYLLRHIQSPILSLNNGLRKLATTVSGSSNNFYNVFDDKCPDWNDGMMS